MMKHAKILFLFLSALIPFAAFADSEDEATAGKKYLLRYQFRPGDVLKWDVTQQIEMKTQVSSQQTVANTYSRSTKVWTVIDVAEDGTAVLEYSVQDAEINNKVMTRNPAAIDEPTVKEEESSYDSKNNNGETPDSSFDEVRKSIGIPLAHMTIDNRGTLLKKVQKAPYAAAAEENRITIPMPENPITEGESWDAPSDIVVSQHNGTVRKIVAKQRFTLEKVQNGIATIKFKTILLTPIDSQKMKMQLIDKQPAGTVRFDIDAGCNLEQQSDVNESVTNWAEGSPSGATYQSRFVEKYCGDGEKK